MEEHQVLTRLVKLPIESLDAIEDGGSLLRGHWQLLQKNKC